MKNQHSQGSHDFSENYGEEPNDRVVTFLKQNKPIAPPAASNFEHQLFVEISKYPQRSPLAKNSTKNLAKNNSAHSRRWWLWTLLIPVVIATGLTFNWATKRSQFQIASNSMQMSEAEKVAIEQSLLSSWNVTDDVVLQTTNIAAPTDTQILIGLAPLEYE